MTLEMMKNEARTRIPPRKKPDGRGQPAERAHPVHPVPVELDVLDALEPAGPRR